MSEDAFRVIADAAYRLSLRTHRIETVNALLTWLVSSPPTITRTETDRFERIAPVAGSILLYGRIDADTAAKLDRLRPRISAIIGRECSIVEVIVILARGRAEI